MKVVSLRKGAFFKHDLIVIIPLRGSTVVVDRQQRRHAPDDDNDEDTESLSTSLSPFLLPMKKYLVLEESMKTLILKEVEISYTLL